jgi:sugar/nucleoside kinase (ribokinase family)
VLVVGDTNPDLLLVGDVVPRFGQAEQLLERADLVLGGSAAITAHGLGRLGRAVALVSAVGEDLFGRWLLDRLDAAGVATEAVLRRADLPTGLTVVLNRGDDRGMLTLPGTIESLTGAEVLAVAERLAAMGLRHVHVASYFLQPGLARELPEVLSALRDLGLRTSLDTNVDPAGRWAGVDLLLPHLDLLLPNRTEVVALGGDPDPRRAAVRLAASGPTVVVKDGERGAFAVLPDGALVEEPAPRVTVVDATGAGDTFDAAFVAARLDGADVPTALRRAVAAGALSVTHAGGTAGQPTDAELSAALADHAVPSGDPL